MLYTIRKILLVLSKREKRRLGMLMMLDLVISVADIVFLALLLLIIQAYTGVAPRSGKFSFLLEGWTGQNSVLLVVVFFLLFSVKNLAGFQVFRAQCQFQFRVASRISKDKLTGYQEGSYSDYINVDSSVNIRKVSYEPLEFCQHVLGGVQQIITQAVLIVLAITGIVLFNAKLFLLILAVLLPPVFTLFYLIKRRMGAVRGSARVSSERSLQHLQEAISGYVESNIYDKNEVFRDRFLTYQHQYSKYLSDQTIVQGIPSRMIEIFALLGVVILIAITRLSGGTDQGAVITIGVFMAAAYKIIPGIVKMLSLSGQINTYAFTLDNLASSARSTPFPFVSMPAGYRPSFPQGRLIRSVQLANVQFRYGGRLVLDKLNLQMAAGDFVGIAGPSGQGKTTILNLILGFLTPDAGEIRINEESADTASCRSYWPDIAYVRQQSFLIHDTVLNNITLRDSPIDEQKLRDAIDLSGLKSLIGSFPEGVDQIIMENGRNISGGQRQRINIARALYKEAGLIILDEPFNELDEESENALLIHFQQLAQKGKLIILITHNRKSLAFCNKIISLDGSSVMIKFSDE